MRFTYPLKYRHPFHLVTPSPWPVLTACSLLSTLLSLVLFFHFYTQSLSLYLTLSFFFFFLSLIAWFNDVIFESTIQGFHSSFVQKGLRLGMLLFIVSEILFFFSFFWAFFHSSLAPVIEIGAIWPPLGIGLFNPWEIPFINTIILLLSGVWATLAHHIIRNTIKKFFFFSFICLVITVCLGLIFTSFQLFEYITAPFTIADSIYGSVFFLMTGFHGLHVLIGTIFLIVITLRNFYQHYLNRYFFSVDAAIWYWHFVDVVWLFLFITIYWWGC